MTKRWVDIGINDWGLYQDPKGLTYGSDAVLLTAFSRIRNPHPILDMGTGTGIIAFLLAHRQGQHRIVAADIQGELIQAAEAAQQRNGISHEQLRFEQVDLRTPPKRYGNAFGTVICNPPYFPEHTGQVCADPARATARQAGSFSTTEVFRSAAYALRQGGRFFLIQRTEALDFILKEALDHKLKPARLQTLHAQASKVAKLFLLECVYEGRCKLELLPPFILYDDAGQPSPQLVRAYKGVCDYEPPAR